MKQAAPARVRFACIAIALLATHVGGLMLAPKAAAQTQHTVTTASPENALDKLQEWLEANPISTPHQHVPGVNQREIAPVDAQAQPLAAVPLASLTQDIVIPRTTDSTSTAQTSQEHQGQALKLYAHARALYLRGDIAQAIDKLNVAIQLFPSHPDIHRLHGECALAAEDAQTARTSLARAHELDPQNAATVRTLGDVYSALGEPEEAQLVYLTWAAHAAAHEQLKEDRAHFAIIHARLANVLGAQGYQLAAAQAADASYTVAPARGANPRDQRELFALNASASRVWRNIGVNYLRHDMPKDATRAIRLALEKTQGLDQTGALPLLVQAHINAGSPSNALLSILDLTTKAHGRSSPQTRELLAWLCKDQQVVLHVDRFFSALSKQQDGPARQQAAQDTALARAAVLPAPEALSVLRDSLSRTPNAQELSLASFRVAASFGIDELATELLLQLERAPFAAPQISARAHAALPAHVPVTSLANALRDGAGQGSATERLAATWANQRAGNTHIAAMLARAGAAAWPNDPALGMSAALLASTPKRYDHALAALRRQDANQTPAWAPIAHAIALLEHKGREQQALALLDEQTIASLPAAFRAQALLVKAQATVALAPAPNNAAYIALLKEASANDPTDQQAYAALLTHLSEGLRQDQQARISLYRREYQTLLSSSPFGRAMRTVQAVHALQQNQPNQAEHALRLLDREYPHQPKIISPLVALWLQSNQHDRAYAWLADRAQRAPAAAVYPVSLSQVLRRKGKPEQAIAVLDAWLKDRPAHPQVSAAAASIADRDLADPARAAAYLNAALAFQPPSPTSTLERARQAVTVGRVQDAFAAIAETQAMLAAPRESNTTSLAEPISRLTASLVRSSENSENSESSAVTTNDALALLDQLMTLESPAPSALVNARIDLTARTGQQPEGVAQTIITLAAQHNVEADYLFNTAFSSYINEANQDRQQALANAVELAKYWAKANTQRKVAATAQWIQMSSLLPTNDALAQAISYAYRKDILPSAIGIVAGAAPAAQDGSRPAPAEIAFNFSNRLHTSGHDAAFEHALRTALMLDPAHAQANNSMGYRLVTASGGDPVKLAKASRLLVVAHALAPDEPNIIDSYGWLLYKAGQLLDHVDENGEVVTQGALTLLSKAHDILLEDEEAAKYSLPIIRDHLGDTLWRIGQHERAAELWQLALEGSQAVLEELKPRVEAGALAQEIIAEYEHVISNNPVKLDAAASDDPQTGEPPVAPMYEGVVIPQAALLLERIRLGEHLLDLDPELEPASEAESPDAAP